MNTKINTIIQIIILSALLLIYLYMLYYINTKKDFPQYVSTSSKLFHIYNLVLLIICLVESILHNMLEPFLAKNFKIFTTGTGKGFICIVISVFFYYSNEFIFILIDVFFISGSVGLYLFDRILNCDTNNMIVDKKDTTIEISVDSNSDREKKEEDKTKSDSNPYNIPEDF